MSGNNTRIKFPFRQNPFAHVWAFAFLCLAMSAASAFFSACGDEPPARILVFSKTAGFRHASIPAGVAALRKLCRDNNILMDTTEDAEKFTEANLKRYNAVVFLNSTGDVLNPAQEADFERFIQAGGGFMGIHSATDTEYGWKWYGGLVGAYFNGHPKIQDAKLQVKDHKHLSTQCLKQDEWMRKDEWYNFKEFNPKVNILLNLDEKSYQGGTMGENHAMAWYHEYDGGKAFYTGGGHTLESYQEPLFLQHLLGGLKYVLGDKKRLCYDDCRTERVPDPTRFTKTVLASDLTEPMEFDLLPNGNILLIERRGDIKMFNPTTELLTVVHHIDVYSESEDGLMGLALDPNYAENNWIYLYYSLPGNKAVNRLSRFVFEGDTLHTLSEKMVLEVPVQREECCHTGGSLTFDARGYLYLSTGDNTNPFASNGFSPSDERPGRSAWDAQKSSGNTNDLRGKILRIKLQPDGSYTCPPDNLFASDGRGRPEIYVMGCRNPYRISVDSRRNMLFWGEVGPDAGEPDTARGPAGHDEVNRARAAGFFGWPYFVGNNKPYRDYDFATDKNGPLNDPLHPINNSPNNTGARELPPAQPALIYYPYSNSPDFPMVRNGGRNAMAGPVYYADQYPAATRLPEYYNGKLIIYEWMRNWMMAVTLDSLGNFSRMEPFADSVTLSRPMDMLIDKNGSLWVLEYGQRWFARNEDARLSRIDYVRGNRPPVARLQADKIAAAAPASIFFSVSKTKDYDGGKLRYELDFGDQTPPVILENKHPALWAGLAQPAPKKAKKNPLDSIQHTYAKPGEYIATLTVTDADGAKGKTKMTLSIGNEPPTVLWDFGGRNRSFYQPGQTVNYAVRVLDREDGSLQDGKIEAATVATSIDYLETGFDITTIAQGHQTAMKASEFAKGKILIGRSDCKACHAMDRTVNGPSYQAISTRYQGKPNMLTVLAKKVIKGGAGAWGQAVMSAHPQISENDATEMVRWILSLNETPAVQQSLPTTGAYTFQIPPPAKKGDKIKPGTFLWQATYRDRGSASQKSASGVEILAFRPAFMQAEQMDSLSMGVTHYRPSGGDTVVLRDLKHRSFFVVKRADLTQIHGVAINVGSGDRNNRQIGGRIELRLGSPDGRLIGTATVPAQNAGAKMTFQEINLKIESPVTDGKFHDLYFVTKNENVASEPVGAVDWVRFDFLQ